jgi:arginyl-tRNA---protein transferase
MQVEMPPHNCGPNNDSLAKADHSESASDEDDEDLNDYELGMMVDDDLSHSEKADTTEGSSNINDIDDDLSHSEKADTTEGSSNINDIENVILDLNGSRVKYKVHTQF